METILILLVIGGVLWWLGRKSHHGYLGHHQRRRCRCHRFRLRR